MTVGPAATGDPGAPAAVTAVPTPDGVRLDFTIPRGADGAAPEDVFASFATYGLRFSNGARIPFSAVVSDPTGQIAQSDATYVDLAPGYYQVSYHVSALLRTPGYLQITPTYGGAPHVEFGIYFKTAGNQSSAYGSNAIVIEVPAATRFSLTYNGTGDAIDGAATLFLLKLRRAP